MIEINLEAKKEQIYKLIEFIKKYNYKIIEEIIFENINNKNDEDIMSNIKQRCKNNIGYLHYYIITVLIIRKNHNYLIISNYLKLKIFTIKKKKSFII